MKKIYIRTKDGFQKTIVEGQKIIVRSPLPNDFSKKKKDSITKEKRIAYVFKIVNPKEILINMLTSQDQLKSNQFIERTNKTNKQIAIREHYFVKITYSDIVNSKNEILDQNEMIQFDKIIHTYSNLKQRLLKNDFYNKKNHTQKEDFNEGQSKEIEISISDSNKELKN